MTDIFHADDDATPLTPDEREDLIPTHITLRRELNELEQTNIAKANQWAFERKRDVLDEGFLKGLHKRMFGEVWKWAGEYRKTEKNIGLNPPFRIQPGSPSNHRGREILDCKQQLYARRDRCAVPSSSRGGTPVSERQRSLVASRGGHADRAARRKAF